MKQLELPREFQPAPLVLAGDVVVLMAFVAVGLGSHGENVSDRPMYWLQTAAPFVLGWLLASSVLGAQSRRARTSYRYASWSAASSWILGVLLGALLRYTPRFLGELSLNAATAVVALQFTLVMTTFGLFFVLPWRLAVVYLSKNLLEVDDVGA